MITSKKKLLICISDYPFPARKNGISIRYYPIIEHVSTIFDIHLMAITDGRVSEDQLQDAYKFCSKVSVYTKRSHPTSTIKKILLRAGSLIPGRLPFKYVRYDQKHLEEFIKTETQGVIYDVALCVLLDNLHLVKKNISAKRYSLDLIDSPYSTFIRTMGKSPLKKIDAYILRCWERRALKKVDYACYISPLDRLLGSGSDNESIGVIPNGLFLSDHTQERKHFGGKCLGYLGHMGYPPNITAANRLYRIYDKIYKEVSDLKLIIIGRDPSDEIKELHIRNNNVLVTGSVDNIWPYINSIDIFVFPMEIGSGQQNKLLEAMAAGIPVISSKLGNSGIGAAHNHQIVIADSDEEFITAIKHLLANEQTRKEIGKEGKKFVDSNYYWPSIFDKIEATLLRSDNL